MRKISVDLERIFEDENADLAFRNFRKMLTSIHQFLYPIFTRDCYIVNKSCLLLLLHMDDDGPPSTCVHI